METLAVARALHVLAVVIWIGGVAMITTIVLPAVRRGELGNDRRRAFAAIERRFVWHARLMLLLAGAKGVYMVMQLDLWSRFGTVRYWWMHAMVGVWSLFALMLFIVEPLDLHKRLRGPGDAGSDTTFRRLHRAHLVLLGLALITLLGAVAGSHGWMP
jgi:uncharacterized membrane protein